jgi:hypothetical protein
MVDMVVRIEGMALEMVLLNTRVLEAPKRC